MDAASIEEMNRIRVSLGMKPLPVPGAEDTSNDFSEASDSEGEAASTLESREAQAYNNYNKVKQAEADKKKRQERSEAIRKAREREQMNAQLEGKGLGEAEGGETDAKSWLMGQKKRQKKIDKARRLEEELAAQEAAAAAAVQYTSKDLAGIKVAHDTSAFLDGDEQVLTLKDTTIDENEEEGDELENLGMREGEKLADRLDTKKKRPGYNPNDMDEDGPAGILAQYDEEIDGKKRKKFTLDADGSIAELSDILGKPTQRAAKLQNVSLDDVVGDAPISSDYLDASEIKVKKPKKKKSKKQTRRKQEDEDDIFPLEPPRPTDDDVNAMDVDDAKPAAQKKRKALDDAFVDDDDLQTSLALQRKKALKKRKKMRPEDIARQLKEQEDNADDDDGAAAAAQEGGLVIDEVSEFVSGLNKEDLDEERERRERRPKARTEAQPGPEEADGDHPMGDGEEPDHAIDQELPATAGEDKGKDKEAEEEEGGEEEKTVGGGMGDALALLRERGLVKETQAGEKYESDRARSEFLAAKRALEEELEAETLRQRERARASGKLDRMSAREREDWSRQQNQWRDQQHSRRLAELFGAGYRPSVELRYRDDDGRALDTKEAFKHLSHQFHGKGSGKGKTEKRLKKIDDERRREAQSLFDAGSGGGMSAAAAQQVKKRKEAGVRLG
ncbi:hypothetical protein N3K66_002672 [Trichothecium roseum]|uniref:Uncharacterized protein n=1 Tax=Trichothecium roseum TaxID=47278 RepID=A0ACC0VC86_9HYPO|nr:hypothetical protein N3K66_002672 [Trichothecium roseum]